MLTREAETAADATARKQVADLAARRPSGLRHQPPLKEISILAPDADADQAARRDVPGQGDRARTAEPKFTPADLRWEVYTPRGAVLRISCTSCCGAYELASEGGQSLVLRPDGDGGHEETARGLHRQALRVYIALAEAHGAEHLRRGGRPCPKRRDDTAEPPSRPPAASTDQLPITSKKSVQS